ncbi:MAG: carboxylesterase family protein [Planctomycetota bacterium]
MTCPVHSIRWLPALLAALWWHGPAAAEELPADAETLVLRDALVIGRVGRAGRSAVHTDAVERMLVTDTWEAPDEGDEIELPDGESRAWARATAAEDGWIQDATLRGGYASFTVQSERERVMLLHARGHSLVYVNGVPRAGDPYGTGFLRLPITLRAGANELLFRVGRGRLWARLARPRTPVMLSAADRTVPDIIRGEGYGVPGGIVVINAGDVALNGLLITSGGGGLPAREVSVPPVAPRTIRKVPFFVGGELPPETRQVEVTLRLSRFIGDRPALLDEATVRLRVRGAGERHRRTFISEIDGSVQYYGITPMAPNAGGGSPAPDEPALFLTLHGAGVEALRQASVYRPKSWGHVVAPTNRRSFGFDWEDWGRLDALEVLDLASRRLGTDPRRTYLTGHSMGGHGTWQIGAHFPDRFAALGPSAGWISFWSYSGAATYEDGGAIEAILRRAAAGSDTLALARNYLHHGIYILHGDADDNVPVEQARMMRDHLQPFHPDLAYHEQPGAGHWWGNECVDWPALFEFFEARARPRASEVDHVEFVTVNPGLASRSAWVAIEAQVEAMSPSAVVIDLDRATRRFEGTATNVARLALDVGQLEADAPVHVTLDGETLEAIEWPANHRRIWLTRDEHGAWSAAADPPPANLKGPHRAGPFKDAFRHRMQFVYGTRGTEAENAWAFAKARYDAETFYYRGNGAADLVPDTDFDPLDERDRSVILYGNATTNAAWEPLIGASPVQVTRGRAEIGGRSIAGDDLACLFLRPRPGSDVACVGVVSGTGLVGMRLADRLPYFVSGVAYPDCTIIDPSMLTGGAAGVRVAGFFGNDWSVEAGDFAWRE